MAHRVTELSPSSRIAKRAINEAQRRRVAGTTDNLEILLLGPLLTSGLQPPASRLPTYISLHATLWGESGETAKTEAQGPAFANRSSPFLAR